MSFIQICISDNIEKGSWRVNNTKLQAFTTGTLLMKQHRLPSKQSSLLKANLVINYKKDRGIQLQQEFPRKNKPNHNYEEYQLQQYPLILHR